MDERKSVTKEGHQPVNGRGPMSFKSEDLSFAFKVKQGKLTVCVLLAYMFLACNECYFPAIPYSLSLPSF